MLHETAARRSGAGAGPVERHDYCLTCREVNGYGGEKVLGVLALIARGLTAQKFVQWALEPSSVNPDATMPALATRLPEAERRALAQSIYDYLSHVQIPPNR